LRYAVLRRSGWIAALPLLVAALPERGQAQAVEDTARTVGAFATRRGFRGYSSYLVGYRQLGGDWGGARHQFVFGAGEAEVTRPGWPLAVVGRVALGYSPNVPPGSRAGSGLSGSYEISLGARRELGMTSAGRLRTWVGAGAAVIGASVQSEERTDEELEAKWTDHAATVGPVLEVGVLRRWGVAFHTGLLGTWSRGSVRPAARRLAAGGPQVVLLLGTRWGKWGRAGGT
jgi:hypothetical protein